jgi:hypothetical protein
MRAYGSLLERDREERIVRGVAADARQLCRMQYARAVHGDAQFEQSSPRVVECERLRRRRRQVTASQMIDVINVCVTSACQQRSHKRTSHSQSQAATMRC